MSIIRKEIRSESTDVPDADPELSAYYALANQNALIKTYWMRYTIRLVACHTFVNQATPKEIVSVLIIFLPGNFSNFL